MARAELAHAAGSGDAAWTQLGTVPRVSHRRWGVRAGLSEPLRNRREPGAGGNETP